MSVKAWKRVITITVLLLILSLIVTTIVYKSKYRKEAEKPLPETVISLEDYGMTDIGEKEKFDAALRYIADMDANSSPKYRSKYKELYVDNPFEYEDLSGQKICYLTFDDGPDVYTTGRILDILKQYDVKATFFVVYNESESAKALLKRMVDEGHTIGVHSAEHSYKAIYKSVTAYLKDFKKVSDWIEDATGIKPEIFRLPGGSINIYNAKKQEAIVTEMLRRGYTYYDWNCNSGDAAASWITADEIKDNVLRETEDDKKIVLMHDGQKHWATLEALESVIQALIEEDYEFRALDKTVEPVRFDY